MQSTIDLAHRLGMRVVAEGVETREAAGLLKAMECDIAQGYLLSRPVPAATPAVAQPPPALQALPPLAVAGHVR